MPSWSTRPEDLPEPRGDTGEQRIACSTKAFHPADPQLLVDVHHDRGCGDAGSTPSSLSGGAGPAGRRGQIAGVAAGQPHGRGDRLGHLRDVRTVCSASWRSACAAGARTQGPDSPGPGSRRRRPRSTASVSARPSTTVWEATRVTAVSAPGQRLHGQPPRRPVLRVDRDAHLLVGPCRPPRRAARTVSDDLDVGRAAPGHPVVPAERQGRLLDPAAQQAAAQVSLEPAQPVEIDGVLVDPGELGERTSTERPQTEKRTLVDVGQRAVHTGMLGGSHASPKRTLPAAATQFVRWHGYSN